MNFIKQLFGINITPSREKTGEKYEMPDGNSIGRGAMQTRMGVPVRGFINVYNNAGKIRETLEISYSLYDCSIEDIGKSREFRKVYKSTTKSD
ncbi:MAG: hypothetical protein V1870_02125 [Candidatus Aenigmatarchaeota archaeon]